MIGARGSRAANLCARKSEASGYDLSSSSAVPLLTAGDGDALTQLAAIILRGSDALESLHYARSSERNTWGLYLLIQQLKRKR